MPVAGAILGAGALSAGASIYGANKAAGSIRTKKVDPNKAQEIARKIAIDNAKESIRLENELTPEVAQLRTDSIRRLLGDIGGEDPYTIASRQRLAALMNGEMDGDISYLKDAADRAREELAMGGDIPLDVRNLVARTAASKASSVGGGGLGLGRDINARDLGLTSLDLRNQRLTNALSTGQAYFDAGQGLFGNRFNATSAFNQLGNQGFSRRLAVAQIGQGIERPEVGLSPGSVVDLMVGNANAQNAANQQRAAIQAGTWNSIGQIGGSLAGAGLGYLGAKGK